MDIHIIIIHRAGTEICPYSRQYENDMYMIGHHDEGIYLQSRTEPRQISAGLGDSTASIVQIHLPVVDISEKTDSVLRAGSSKWNTVEHRLFSRISTNWEGEPLDSYEKILKFIRTTKTDTGFKVRAFLSKKNYPKGGSISDREMKTLSIKPHSTFTKWNYTISPRNLTN